VDLVAAADRPYVVRVSRVRVTVVSDSHLSGRTPEAAANWEAVVDHVAATRPDLVVHAGDVTADGADRPADLAFARERLDRLSVPWAVVPGNHDVGDTPATPGDGPFVDAARVARFAATFGSDRFAIDVGAWRLVGLDAQLLGAGGDPEADQWAWLGDRLHGLDPAMPLALVLHRPLLPGDDTDSPVRYVPPAARARLLDVLEPVDARLVVSGHVHESLRHRTAGLDHVWAPTTWAVVPDRLQSAVGRKLTGLVELTLHDDGRVDVRPAAPPGVRHHVFGEDVADPYGLVPPAAGNG
jgi:3',5'-cyclic AMP phosphodiesterase CpdA